MVSLRMYVVFGVTNWSKATCRKKGKSRLLIQMLYSYNGNRFAQG
jgi:hypothetical protein